MRGCRMTASSRGGDRSHSRRPPVAHCTSRGTARGLLAGSPALAPNREVIPMVRHRRATLRENDATDALVDQLRDRSLPLQGEGDLDPLLERIGEARYVLLGEASHGTSEYYTWRAALSRRLITEKGFSFLAVEGDWPDCYRVNRYVKGYS